MLRIKRASAGSGKTYELAKTYIKLLITAKHSGYKRLLLKNESFRETLSSIMAVTFTVKATAEMKQRIVEKLADLGRADSMADEDIGSIDYLKELVDDFHSSKEEIAALARRALRTLLLHYSDFRVQTIDSFFQGILHTFAYEASVDDRFNMEIYSDIVTSAGFDLALDDMAADSADESLHWLRIMIERSLGSTKWNVFTRQEGSRSLYSRLIREAQNLELEDYHKIREQIEEYFAGLDRPFREIVKDVDDANFAPAEELHARRRETGARLLRTLRDEGLAPKDISNSNGRHLLDSVEELDRDEFRPPYKEIAPRQVKGLACGALSKSADDTLKERTGGGAPYAEACGRIDADFAAWQAASNRYLEYWKSSKELLLTWIEYRALLPRLMMVLEIGRRKKEYLKANNSLQLSDTTRILSRIIGEDDAPFVYERVGSRLSHYLIDEFQDTSAMQWDNLRPLLKESEATDNENLIIGDAKQSIYRFRNADYRLIGALEREFHNVVYYTTENPPEGKSARNTNYRSKPRVVEFNNYIFSTIAGMSDPKDGSPIFAPAVATVYEDSVQAIPPQKLEAGERGASQGYVETIFYPKASETGQSDDEENGDEEQPGFRELPARILELRGRGYDFRDIGILVKNHEQGMAAVKVIAAHNAADKDNQIPVISEENLLVGSALSVRIVLHALAMIASGQGEKTEENPVLSEPIGEDELFALVSALQTPGLPTLVEAVVKKFVPSLRREEEAPYLSAFQDAVVDYCSGHSGDVGSFLKWWRQKSRTLSITSPEDSDGVRLQTIHKAKGLEYECVIIPIAKFDFEPGNFTEWRWVEVESRLPGADLLPPVLPVMTRKSLAETVHRAELERYREEYALDELNKMYVGFTRAVSELYVYVPVGKTREERKAGGMLRRLLATEEFNEAASRLLAGSPDVGEREDGGVAVRYGIPSSENQVRREKERKERKRDKEGRKVLQLGRCPDASEGADASGVEAAVHKEPIYPEGDANTVNPTIEGTLKHRLMESVDAPGGMEKAIRKMKAEGSVASATIDVWAAELQSAIGSVSGRGWFDPRNRVFVERPVIAKGTPPRRPDRCVVTPEGEAIVIDYKFGSVDGSGDDVGQVGDYAEVLAGSGRFRSVSAFIWYVSKQEIVQVYPRNGNFC